jgi:hypothetical protein
MKFLVVDDSCAARAVLIAYVRQWEPTGESFVRDVDFFDIIFLVRDEECPAFFELFCVIGELKPDALVVVVSRGPTNQCR